MGIVLSLLTASAWSVPRSPGGDTQAWIAAHPQLSVGVYDSGWPPLEYVEGAQVRGLAPDVLASLAAGLGVTLHYRHYPSWAQVLEAACRGEIDIVMNVAPSSDPARCLAYTGAYADAPLAVVGRPGDLRASDDPDLSGLRVVSEQGFLTQEKIRSRFPRARLMAVPTTLDALRKVAQDQADVFIGNSYVAGHLIQAHGLDNVALLRPSDLPVESLHFGVPLSKAPLVEALDEAMAREPVSLRAERAARWLRVPVWSDPARQALNQAERRALSTPLRLGFAPNAAPLSYADGSGAPSGLASEYLQRLRQAGATLDVEGSHDWFDLREKMRRGRLDAVMGVPTDSHYLGTDWVFSQPFISVPNVIVTGPGSGTVLQMGDLAGKRVLLSDPERLRAQVLQQAPQARILAARSAEQALQRLLDGEAQAYIGNLAIVDRLLRERFPGQLQVAAPAGFDDHLSLAVKREYAPLATRFDRLLQQMGPREREALRNDWLAVEYRSGTDWRTAARWAVPIVLVLLTALLVHALGYWRLRREVAGRRALEQRLADVTRNLPAIVYQMRRTADGTLGFPYVAGDMQALFGIQQEVAMASAAALLDCIDARDRPQVEAAIAHAARDFLPLSLEFRTTAEPSRWVRSQAQPYATDAGTVTWSGYWVDITDAHRQADALAQANAAAEQAADAKARFLATMSHEIRTPMSGVLGMLEILAHSPLQPQQRVHLAEAEQAAQSLRRMLDDILDYAKIDAGALRLDPLPLPLQPLLESLQRQFDEAATRKGLALRLDIDSRLATAHEVDGLRLRQVLGNLLANAIRFTDTGTVLLRVEVLEGSSPSLQDLRLQVIDTGVGMDQGQVRGVFQPFAAGDVPVTRDVGGTGLGLTLCQRLVQLMGGRLLVHSTLGSGTEVDVLLQLPVASDDDIAAALPGPDSVPPLPANLQQARVLVVEDHPTAQAMMAWRLEQLGVAHAVASDGREALQMLAASAQGEAFDLVITDCRMPVMDGYAFTRLLREREQRQGGARLPVVALTASLLEQDLRRCREAGMDEVLTKPLSLAHLRECLLRWLHPTDPPPVVPAG
ncbi:response regulator [Stenotrophomonas sp. WHRI 8082]|uniref:response regulator n=1 Tax=Stenotrophomonas sp. WHRI 8082 TaxID=3162571 RepID=UPI0032ECC090